jgi:hypothetical protein
MTTRFAPSPTGQLHKGHAFSALTAFALSAAVHGATTLMAGEHALMALAFWGIPHLLVLPLLLWSARGQATRADRGQE